VKITAKTLNARGWNQAGNGDWGNATGEQVVRNERNTWTHVDKSGNKTQYPTLQDAFKNILAEPTVEKVTPPSRPSTKTTEGKAVAVKNLKQGDVDFLESLAAKYGAPPRPIVGAKGQAEQIARASNMLERAASKSASASELSQILDVAQRIKSGRAVISVAHNRATDTATFEKAAQDPEANKTVSPSYWEGIRTRRAERATPESASEISTPSPAVESTTAETAKPVTAKAIPSEVKQVLDTLDSPKGKTPRVRKLVNGEHPNIGPKAIFINDNIEQIIAEAEATGKVTKICP
jgi:hypothetical protein